MVDKLGEEPAAEQLLRVALHRGPVAIVVIAEGEVDMLTAGRLEAAVNEALTEAAGQAVVIDLTAVTFLGSHGLAVLAKLASKAEGRRQLLRVVVDETRPVVRPIQLTGLDEVLALYYSVEEALPQ